VVNNARRSDTPCSENSNGGGKYYLGSDILMPDEIGWPEKQIATPGRSDTPCSGNSNGSGKSYLGRDILMSGEPGRASEH
jgi:hypothetical protein